MAAWYDEQKVLNQEALNNPARGDYWHEMFSPAILVLEVTDGNVLMYHKTKAVDKGRWSWDVSEIIYC